MPPRGAPLRLFTFLAQMDPRKCCCLVDPSDSTCGSAALRNFATTALLRFSVRRYERDLSVPGLHHTACAL